MFYTFKNCSILVNGTGFLVESAGVSVGSRNDPIYLVGDRHTPDFSAEGVIGGTLRFNYLLTGRDPLKQFLENETNVISGHFGGLFFKTGYLTSYNLDAEPNKPPEINAQISFFDALRGEFAPVYERPDAREFLTFSDATATDFSGTALLSSDTIKSLSYSFSSDVQPLILLNDTIPVGMSFGPKEIRTKLISDVMSGDMPLSGRLLGVTFSFRHPTFSAETETYKCLGIIEQREISTAVGNLLESSMSVRQARVEDPPTISGIDPAAGDPGAVVNISGTNLRTVTAVWFHDLLAENFTGLSQIKVVARVPSGAISGPIRVKTFGGEARS